MNKVETYEFAFEQLVAVLEDVTDRIAIMATINCILKSHFPHYYWVGFYIVKNDALIVGPYQGTLGCLHIEFGRGVCGTAAATRETQVVEDVHAFAGHIACDAASASEIVVPVLDGQNNLLAVFDVDSTEKGSFDQVDRQHLERIMTRFFSEQVTD